MRKLFVFSAYFVACIFLPLTLRSADRTLIAEYVPGDTNKSFFRREIELRTRYDRILRRVVLLSGSSQLAGTAISVFTEQTVIVVVYCGAGNEHCSIYFPIELLNTTTNQEFEAIMAHECWHIIGGEDQGPADQFAISLLKKDSIDPYSLLSFLEKNSRLLPINRADRKRLKYLRKLLAKDTANSRRR